MKLRVLSAVICACVMIAPASASSPSPGCSTAGRSVVSRLRDLPPTVRAKLPVPIADRGEPFQATDVVERGHPLPLYRFVCGYPEADGFVVEREHGGRGYGIDRLVVKPGL